MIAKATRRVHRAGKCLFGRRIFAALRRERQDAILVRLAGLAVGIQPLTLAQSGRRAGPRLAFILSRRPSTLGASFGAGIDVSLEKRPPRRHAGGVRRAGRRGRKVLSRPAICVGHGRIGRAGPRSCRHRLPPQAGSPSYLPKDPRALGGDRDRRPPSSRPILGRSRSDFPRTR